MSRAIVDDPENLADIEDDPNFMSGIQAVISIRCMRHFAVPQYNTNEGPGECAACAVIEATAIADALLDDAQVCTRDLLRVLGNLAGLAKSRGGHLHEYKSAVEEAEALIAKYAVKELPNGANE